MEDEGIEKLQLQPGLLDLFQWIREHSHGPYKTVRVLRVSCVRVVLITCAGTMCAGHRDP
jgi:hypothetical protein